MEFIAFRKTALPDRCGGHVNDRLCDAVWAGAVFEDPRQRFAESIQFATIARPGNPATIARPDNQPPTVTGG